MSDRKEILFVDDEPHVLDGLRRMLRPMRNDWNMHFVTSGELALQQMETQAPDVIVTDMRMPGMNGAELLTQIRELHPQVVRIVLSGHADEQMILQTIKCTHQFLSKPCDAEVLRAVIERASRAQKGSRDEKVMAIVSRLTDVPSFPANYDELVGRIRDPESSVEQIAAVVARDPSMSAHILKLVNSAFFGLPRRVADIAEAVNFIGLETLRSLVLSAHIFHELRATNSGFFSFEAVRDHSLRTANGAKAIANLERVGTALAGESFAAGMLHDIGRLVLAQNFPDQYGLIATDTQAHGRALCEAEEQILDMNHAEVGAAMLSIWGLPDTLIDATAWHHQPSRSTHTGLCPLTFVHVAAAWADAAGKGTEETPTLDDIYLEANGLQDRIPLWKDTFNEACTS